MKTSKLVLSLVVAGLLFAPAAFAAKGGDIKFAYVDLGKVFEEYKKTKIYNEQMEKENKAFQDERQKMIDAIRDAQNKLALLKEDEKKKMEAELDKMKQQLLEFDRQKRTDLVKKRDEMGREIFLEIEKIVSDYAKKENITLVLNDRDLIYGDSSLNITDIILKTINDNFAKGNK